MNIKKAVIPAAGRGTRLERITLVTAKELIPLVDKPAIDWIVKEATLAGIEELCIVTSVNKIAALNSHTEDLPVKVTYLIQSKPLGLGHAVLVAKEWCGDDPFALLLPDDFILGDPILTRLVEESSRTRNSSLALTEVPSDKTYMYGIADGDQKDGTVKISDLVEKPAAGTEPSNFSITGRYVLTADLWPLLEAVKPGAGGEIQLTDALKELAYQGKLTGLLTKGMRHDLGSPESWLKANIAYGAQVYGQPWLDTVIASLRE
jgi:UTP--glucose-1-phosphate uridylyltransferase